MNAFLEPLSNTIVVNKLDIIFGTSLGLFKYCDKNDKNHDNISSISLNIMAKNRDLHYSSYLFGSLGLRLCKGFGLVVFLHLVLARSAMVPLHFMLLLLLFHTFTFSHFNFHLVIT